MQLREKIAGSIINIKDDGTNANRVTRAKEAAGLMGNVVLNARQNYYFQICHLKVNHLLLRIWLKSHF